MPYEVRPRQNQMVLTLLNLVYSMVTYHIDHLMVGMAASPSQLAVIVAFLSVRIVLSDRPLFSFVKCRLSI